ncbi:fad dependent oxidoreductase like [Lecanosticta acicola]|uniref:Fad dependent oxidoreductase like n=1 Tax=Lecanosticta acicola TaxID=111012 RepID=A0AAI8Z771_9PEZI|nr:fad dependent oxidoreductase like [Lecanosticta acicola]
MSLSKPDVPRQRMPCGLPSPESTSSFWHKEPSPLLLGHRSTRDLPETADVVIIGAGMTGASAAHHLLTNAGATKKLNVVLLEAREACWGATGRNGGHCQPILFEHPNDPSIGDFELKNFHTLHSLIQEKSIHCEFVSQPGVRAIYSKHHLDQVSTAIQKIQSTAPHQADMMRIVTDRDELNALRIPTAIGAVVTSLAARMWPYKFVSRILTDLLTTPNLPGGTFNLQTLTPVHSIHQTSETITTTTTTTIHTSRGSISTPKIILATNAYTSHLLPAFASLIVPCRGQMSALNPLPSISSQSRLKTSYGFLGDGLDDYLIQRPTESGGHLMFGGGRQHGPSMGTVDDNQLDAQTAAYLRGKLIEAMNLPEGGGGGGGEDGVREMRATHEWTGIMGFSRDDVPWVGPVPGQEGVYTAAGFTGHGMPNTWLCGKAVALMVGRSLEGGEEAAVMDEVRKETGLPESYLSSKERMEKALMECEDPETKDWNEMQRETVKRG